MCVYGNNFCRFEMLLLQCLAVAFMIAVMYANLTVVVAIAKMI